MGGDYPKAEITVLYATLTYETSGDDAFLSEKFSANQITMPGTCYKFADNTPVEGGVGRLVPEVEYSQTWHKLATLDTTTILSCVGKVNSSTWKGCAAGTVLFAGGDSDNQVALGGTSKKSIQYAFLYRPVPWNYLLHPTAGTFQAVTAVGSGNGIYETTDLNVLI